MDLITAVRNLAVELPAGLTNEIAVAFAAQPAPTGRAKVAISRAVAQPRAREIALSLFDAWESEAPTAAGASVTLAIRAATAVAQQLRDEQVVELVWTGPTTTVALRKTREALRDICRQAKRTLMLSSFSTSRDDGALEELVAAASREVKITLILDTQPGSSTDAGEVFQALRGKAAFYTWPVVNRPPRRYSAMHVKTAVADQGAALISSANLSAAAMNANMELGVLIVGEPLPRLLEKHILELIAIGQLTPLYP